MSYLMPKLKKKHRSLPCFVVQEPPNGYRLNFFSHNINRYDVLHESIQHK